MKWKQASSGFTNSFSIVLLWSDFWWPECLPYNYSYNEIAYMMKNFCGFQERALTTILYSCGCTQSGACAGPDPVIRPMRMGNRLLVLVS